MISSRPQTKIGQYDLEYGVLYRMTGPDLFPTLVYRAQPVGFSTEYIELFSIEDGERIINVPEGAQFENIMPTLHIG